MKILLNIFVYLILTTSIFPKEPIIFDTLFIKSDSPSHCESLTDSIYESYFSDIDAFMFIKSVSGSILPQQRLMSEIFFQHDFGDILTNGLLLNFNYGLNKDFELGAKLNYHSVPNHSGFSEIMASVKYLLPIKISNENLVTYFRLRKSFGEAYVKEFNNPRKKIVGITSKYFDSGSDISVGFLVKKALLLMDFGFNLTGGIEYSYMGNRNYYDFTDEHKTSFVFFLNLDKKFSNKVSAGIENRLLYWINRGEAFDIIPQVKYRINPNFVIGAGLSIPLSRTDFGIYLSTQIKLSSSDEPFISCIYDDTTLITPEINDEPCQFDTTFDLSNAELNFFVTGYYRINTRKNLDELINLNKTLLKNCNYIEKFGINSELYKKYSDYAVKVENVILDLENKLLPVFEKFDKCSNEQDALLFTIYGYTDPRRVTGKFEEDYNIEFYDEKDNLLSVKKGSSMSNLILGGLRSYFTGQYLDEYFKSKSEFYNNLLRKNKIKMKYISAVSSKSQEENPKIPSIFDAQRKIRIDIKKISK